MRPFFLHSMYSFFSSSILMLMLLDFFPSDLLVFFTYIEIHIRNQARAPSSSHRTSGKKRDRSHPSIHPYHQSAAILPKHTHTRRYIIYKLWIQSYMQKQLEFIFSFCCFSVFIYSMLFWLWISSLFLLLVVVVGLYCIEWIIYMHTLQ